MATEVLVDKHYGVGGVMERIEAGLGLAGKDLDSLTVDDLAPVDAFHTRGRESTLEVAELAKLAASDYVLDVGCGLGGTARHLADRFECKVVGIDLTEEYVAVGRKLTELVGLSERVEIRQANALEIPFESGTFDLVYTEHAQMNIADKDTFYSEMARVLKPGGRLVFHDIFRGLGEDPIYPTPWAEDASISALATEDSVRKILETAGLAIDSWQSKVEESIEFFAKVAEQVKVKGVPPIGIHLLMGDNAIEKLQNYARNLREERVSVVLGRANK